tara:strand:+ start:322 stop:873 length:552 start_codon:yes stop_codon:yes gene_type:complete
MPDVNQTITDFYRVAQDKDFQRDFQFRVLNIQGGDGTTASFTEDDLVYIRTATLPGKTIQNKTVPYMGLQFNVPGSVTYDGSAAWAVQFYCDQSSAIRQTFEKYLQDIFDDETSTGNYFMPKSTAIVDLVQLNTQLEAVASYQLVGVYATSLGALSYSPADGTGDTMKFDATLAYQYWRRKTP